MSRVLYTFGSTKVRAGVSKKHLDDTAGAAIAITTHNPAEIGRALGSVVRSGSGLMHDSALATHDMFRVGSDIASIPVRGVISGTRNVVARLFG